MRCHARWAIRTCCMHQVNGSTWVSACFPPQFKDKLVTVCGLRSQSFPESFLLWSDMLVAHSTTKPASLYIHSFSCAASATRLATVSLPRFTLSVTEMPIQYYNTKIYGHHREIFMVRAHIQCVPLVTHF